jgi:hypothetical protein
MRHAHAWLAAASLCAAVSAGAQVNVTTYHNDNARTGQNTAETMLTPANVNSTQFGKLFSTAVDGYVYAQPLYLSGVAIGGGTHDVVYAATEHDSVYAIDGANGTVYWRVSLIPAGGRTVNTETDVNGDCNDLVPEVGITGTPVIDAAGGTLYVVAKSYVNGHAVQYLHALDVTSGAEKFGGPVQIAAAVSGTGYDAVGGVVTFNPLLENQRAALLLTAGHVVIAWGAHCDFDPWHGWVMSYGASNLALEAAFNTSPNGQRGGIWMSGGGPAADSAGNIYFATGNGTWNGTTDFGDSIVKLAPPTGGRFAVLDYFTPYNQSALAGDDKDVASGGLVLLPTLPSGGQLLAQQGKQGTIYLLDRNDLGKYCVKQSPACSGKDPQIVQEIVGASGGLWGSPTYWNGLVYWTGVNEPIRAFAVNANGSGVLSTRFVAESSQSFAFSSPTPSVSSNGNADAILWALDGASVDSVCVAGADCLGLFAYPANDLGSPLYESSQAANHRDSPGAAVKFEIPIIANGKVYVGTQGSVSGYGLLGTHLPPGVVSLAATENVVAFAGNGSPITNGGIDANGDAFSANLLGSSITWAGNTFVLGGAGANDAVSGATVALPAGNDTTVSLLATAVNGSQTAQKFVVTYTDGTATSFTQSLSDWHTPQNYAGESQVLAMAYRLTASGAADNRPFYLYGYTFAVNSAKTVASISLPDNRNVVVLAIDVSANASLQPASSPVLNPPAGNYASAQTVTLSDSTYGAVIHYTTNGATPTAASAVYSAAAPLQLTATTTVQAVAVAAGYADSAVTSGTYTISQQGSAPIKVPLAPAANVVAIGIDGEPVPNGGLDASGDAFSGTLLGSPVTWAGAIYAPGPAGQRDAVSSATIPLPAANAATLSLLATAVHGAAMNQVFVINYTDGTTTRVMQSLSDWHVPQQFAGESQAVGMAYRLLPTGAQDDRPFYLYGYSLALNPAKTLKSIALPANRNVVVLAMVLTP